MKQSAYFIAYNIYILKKMQDRVQIYGSQDKYCSLHTLRDPFPGENSVSQMNRNPDR